jgi:hypothetical protein
MSLLWRPVREDDLNLLVFLGHMTTEDVDCAKPSNADVETVGVIEQHSDASDLKRSEQNKACQSNAVSSHKQINGQCHGWVLVVAYEWPATQ